MKKQLLKKLLTLAISLAIVLAWGISAWAYDGYSNPIRVRVGASSGSVSVGISVGNYTVLNSGGGQVATLTPGQTHTLTGGQTLSSRDGNGRFTYNGKEYRGDLTNTGQYIVNRLGMEEYLYSVVSREIGGYAPDIEALKAQAVAARSLACNGKKNPRTQDYDLLATTSDQVYEGYTGEDYSDNPASVSYRIREACNGTANEVMYSNGTVAKGIYCANTGGYSADSGSVWGGNSSYLQGVSVPYDSQSFVADNFSSSSGASYKVVKMPTSYQWRKTFTYSQIAEKVSAAGGKSLGVLQDIEIESLPGGYAKEVTFVGSNARITLSGSEVRSCLSLRSANFSVILGESLSATQPFTLRYLESGSFDSFLNRSGRVVNFQGRGYGHSVGMSQWGACVMAYQGKNYKEILNYFYTNISIEGFKG